MLHSLAHVCAIACTRSPAGGLDVALLLCRTFVCLGPSGLPELRTHPRTAEMPCVAWCGWVRSSSLLAQALTWRERLLERPPQYCNLQSTQQLQVLLLSLSQHHIRSVERSSPKQRGKYMETGGGKRWGTGKGWQRQGNRERGREEIRLFCDCVFFVVKWMFVGKD